MKTSIGVIVNIKGTEEGAAADATRWLANVIRFGIAVEHAVLGIPASPVECDQVNGVITIDEARRP